MKAQQEPANSSTAVNDESVLSVGDIKAFAKLIDVLMEADFEINRNERVVANAC